MTTAVDTSILIDLLLDDPAFATASERALQACRKQGRLIVGETVVAEVRPALGSDQEVRAFLNDLHIEFVPSTEEASLLAGSIFAGYLKNKGPAKRVVPDFLVAAHAVCLADGLLARDRGYYRTYFSRLKLLDPTPGTPS